MVIQNGVNKVDIYVIKTRFDITTLPKNEIIIQSTSDDKNLKVEEMFAVGILILPEMYQTIKSNII